MHHCTEPADEVFGADNFVSVISYRKSSGAGSFKCRTKCLPSVRGLHPLVARDRQRVKYRRLLGEGVGWRRGRQVHDVELPDGSRRPATTDEIASGISLGR